MDSDSPAVTSIAGQPTRDLGTLFKTGNTRDFAWREFAGFGGDAIPEAGHGYRRSSSHHRSRHGEGA